MGDHDYLKQLNANSLVLSLGQKTNTHWIMTGRTLEALIAPHGGTLIQQESQYCKPLGDFLTPFWDYLPFSIPGELSDFISLAEQEPKFVADIARSGQRQIDKIFRKQKLLEAVLA